MTATSDQLAPTGIEGLDEILNGGVPRGGIYTIHGAAGSGKTIAGLQFLKSGAERGERCLFLSLSQSEAGIREAARGLGWKIDKITLHQLSRQREREHLAHRQVVFDRVELELDELMDELLGVVEEHSPDLVVFDAISHLRLLTEDDLLYRRQLLTIRDFFSERDATLVLTNNLHVAPGSGELSDISTGVIELIRGTLAFGTEFRAIEVVKVRGRNYRAGRHDLWIGPDGIEVASRITSLSAEADSTVMEISSGEESLDSLLGGGLLTGTSALFLGASGTGKSSIASLYAFAAAERHGAALIYTFDETTDTFVRRSEGLNLPARRLLAEDKLRLMHVPTASLSPGAFADRVRKDVDETGARVVMIDSLTGYLNAMPNAQMLETQMHDLVMYLNNRNVLSMLVVAQHGLFGASVKDPVDVSYMADTVVLLRHFEHRGALRRAISVFKKRYGDHENRIRELIIRDGVSAGEPLRDFESVLSGAPRLIASNGSDETLHDG